MVWIPRATLRLPLELRVPEGFRPEAMETWPSVDGRLEYVGGRLLFMPPCGDLQQDVCAAVVGELYAWVKSHPEFVVAANEAGMILGGDARAADAAVWRRDDTEPRSGGFRRSAPVLAVEVGGRDESEDGARAFDALAVRPSSALEAVVDAADEALGAFGREPYFAERRFHLSVAEGDDDDDDRSRSRDGSDASSDSDSDAGGDVVDVDVDSVIVKAGHRRFEIPL